MKWNIFILLILFNVNIYSDFEVSTSSGYIDGYLSGGLIHWDDIPYAQPPVGDLRWKAPRPLLNSDMQISSKENNFCIQKTSSLGGSSLYSENLISGSEDCLYLDIIAPKKKSKNKLPVMFWIHGGGNTSGLKDLYDFSKMAKKHHVLIVRINYRLGPFGWFTHPAIQKGQDGLDQSSNFGTLDIISALEWVQENIHLFGGDPSNVTIFGESAGGHNVLSLLVSAQAKNLFHKAISMSGYTTSISSDMAYKQNSFSSTSNNTSWSIVNKILKDNQENYTLDEIREILYTTDAEAFFNHYAERPSYEEIPLLTNDDIVIPEIGLAKALSDERYVAKIPLIAGSNRDEVKLWLATAEYFVELEYSFLGSILNIPKVKLKDEDAFEAFNFYRSAAWKIRGVDEPLHGILNAGNKSLYAYRFDWDDHRRLLIADFKSLIGAAHATEIPLLAGNEKLVGGYPLSDLIYPAGRSKFYISRNLMKFWTNFAHTGNPGASTNSIEWNSFGDDFSYMVLDNKNDLRMDSKKYTFKELSNKLYLDNRVNELEKCVILLQMFTFVGNDIYDDNIQYYPGKCDRSESENFLIENASYIEY
tara:strand:- start:3242 stop:5005 length:1764 start_codon:yes stop_codon:yes gene_type:complete